MKYSTIYILISRTHFYQYLFIFSQWVTFSLNINILSYRSVAIKGKCHLSLSENVTISYIKNLTSCIVIYRRCFL